MINLRLSIVSFLIILNFFISPAITAQSSDVESRKWADKIIEVLPADPALNVIDDPSLESLSNADLKTLRHAVQDVASDRLKLPRDELLSLYLELSTSENSPTDVELAGLFQVSGQPGNLSDYGALEPYLLSSNWFVVMSAYLEQARHLLYQDRSKAQKALKKAILQLPSDPDDPLYEEAKYNIAVLAQVLTNDFGDLESAYKTSETLIDLSVAQDRIVDRFLIVFNLVNIHASTFAFEDTNRITSALIENSKRQSVDRQLLALASHGYYTVKLGDGTPVLPVLETGIDLVGQSSDFYDLYFLDGLANAYADAGETNKARDTVSQIRQIRKRVGYPEGNDISLNILDAKIARALGDFEVSDGLEAKISKELFRQTITQSRQATSSVDFDFLTQNTKNQQFGSTFKTYAFELPIGSLVGIDNTRNSVPEDIVRKIAEFQMELDLFSVGSKEKSERRDLIDAVFGRTNLDPVKALSAYRKQSQGQSEQDDVLIDIFDSYIQSPDQLVAVDRSDPVGNIYGHVLNAITALRAGSYEDAYASFAAASISAQAMDSPPKELIFDLSEVEMAIAMNNGNPGAVLEAGKNYLIAGQALSQPANILEVVAGNVLNTLDGANYSADMLRLSERFILAAQRNQTSMNAALLSKGKALNDLKRYTEAVTFLSVALEEASLESSRIYVLQELFIANAGAGNIDEAIADRKEFLSELNKINDPNLTNMASVFLAHGDYLLALKNAQSSAPDLFENWKKKDRDYENALARRRTRLQNIRLDANFAASQALGRIQEASQLNLDQKITTQKNITRLFGLFTLSSLIAMALGYRKLTQTRRDEAEALKAAKVKGQFLNLIGHESRVSLQGIESFVDSLKSSSVSMEHLPTVQIIGSQASALSQSISDYIFSARVISGDRPNVPKIFTPPEYRTRMLPVWQDIIGGRDVAISMNISPNMPSVYVDSFFLETAIGQIIKIAIQKTRVGTIEVEISEERSLRGIRLNVSIEDTGSGISDEDQNALFDFFEVDENGVSKVMHSQPLGFAIAKNAIDTLDGVMTVFSRLGRGTRVNFSVPVRRAADNDIQDD